MNHILRNVLAVIVGFFIGSAVNMGLITLSPHVIPPPPGVDVTDMESLKAALPLFQPQHFIFPFLAHALGTLVAAFVAAKMARTHALKLAIGISLFFMLGGLINVIMLSSPAWFAVLDLGGAYLPMGWFGYKLASIRPASEKV